MAATPHTVLYDSDCMMCTFQMRSLTWLDWFNLTHFLPIKDERAAEVAPSISREDLLEAIHCITPRGDIHRGARAIRYLGLRMTLLVPLALVLWVPGVIWVAERMYMWVSRNRHLISRYFGCKEACAIMPERKRDL